MFEQVAIGVVETEQYQRLHAQIDAAFAERDVEVFLNKVCRAGLGIRNVEAVIDRGLLGKDAAGLYGSLPVSDQALTRERYLALVETVSPQLRQRYRKAYTGY